MSEELEPGLPSRMRDAMRRLDTATLGNVPIAGRVCWNCPTRCDPYPKGQACNEGSRYGDRLECCMARWQAPMSRQERRALQRELDKRTGTP